MKPIQWLVRKLYRRRFHYRPLTVNQAQLVGQTVAYDPGPDQDLIHGVCTGFERTGTTVWNTETGQEWEGIRFQIQTSAGTRIWTCVYPDETRPVKEKP